ncbi:DUF3307 domain-containing protein [Aquimarina sediminis]|uniref:DUF3307 domain-containing protein n=1 Tax=Aquimarina sediminis TaxID=2070536 RepID=UPI000CA03782|nr:DUF3307 domain-containing protein [Aquimarina sediminis]
MIALILKLTLSHLMGDFLFQPLSWVKDKEEKKYKSIYLYLHILIHTLLLFILLQFNIKYWVGILFIVLSHFCIDILKISLKNRFNQRILFFGDQALHLIMIGFVTYYYYPYDLPFSYLFTPKFILFITSILIVTIVTSVIMKTIISKWDIEDDRDSLEMAGSYIGMLERILIFVFIISDHWEGIGFLLAAKSVFRYGDLSKTKDRKLTEYILIGTLISFGLAMLTGIGYNYFLELIPANL